jgi:hypothetical protein
MAVNPILAANQVQDLQTTTLAEYNKGHLVDISADLQNYIVMRLLLRQGKTKTVESGKSFTWTVMVNDTGSAQNVGLAYQDDVSQVDVATQASADWRHSKVDWAMIGQIVQMNANPAQIVDMEMMQEKAALIAFVKLAEGNFFGPPVAITDGITPWGINTWVVKNATEGFNGGLPAGYSTIGGLDPAQYVNWKNYTFQYTSADDPDFIRKLNRAVEFTDFRPPVDGLPLLNSGPEDYMFFSNYGLIGPLQEYLKASNEALGMDLTKYLGSVMINRRPLIRVPFLEADTTNPIYGIPFKDVFLYRLKNYWGRKTHLPNLPGSHNVAATFLDYSYQFCWVNRRGSFVGATGVTYPS